MKILALDIATVTGWAVDGPQVCPPLSGHYRVPGGGNALGLAGLSFQEWLYDMIGLHGADQIVFEAPVMTSRGIQTNPNTMILLQGLAFSARAMAQARRIRAIPVSVQTWRKHFIGHGRPTNPKKAAVDQCRMLRWDPAGHDEADAMGVWAWGKAKFDPSFRLEAATPLFGGTAA